MRRVAACCREGWRAIGPTGERRNYARTIVARTLLPCRQIWVAGRADPRKSIAHPILSDAQQKFRTANKTAAKDRVRSQGPGLVGPASFAPVRPAAGSQCARGPKRKRRALRSGAEGSAGQSASPAPLRFSQPSLMHADTQKGRNRRRLLPNRASELEHRTGHSMHYAACQMRRQRIVVALIEGEVTEIVILDDVLVKEAVQSTPFGNSQSFEIAVRALYRLSECSHDILLMSALKRQEDRQTGVLVPGHRIARTGDHEVAVGGTILSNCSAAKEDKMVGPRRP